MHAEETEVVTGAQARNNQLLLGFGRGRFFENILDLIGALTRVHEMTADGSVEWQFALMCGLHGRYGAVLSPRDSYELSRACCVQAADVKVVADEQ